jgi:hypothetical protein
VPTWTKSTFEVTIVSHTVWTSNVSATSKPSCGKTGPKTVQVGVSIGRTVSGDQKGTWWLDERNLYGFATKPGDQWIPVDASQKEKNIKKMEEICAKVPSSIDE